MYIFGNAGELCVSCKNGVCVRDANGRQQAFPKHQQAFPRHQHGSAEQKSKAAAGGLLHSSHLAVSAAPSLMPCYLACSRDHGRRGCHGSPSTSVTLVTFMSAAVRLESILRMGGGPSRVALDSQAPTVSTTHTRVAGCVHWVSVTSTIFRTTAEVTKARSPIRRRYNGHSIRAIASDASSER